MNEMTAVADQEPRWARLTRRFVGAAYILLLPLGIMLAVSSVFATDAPGSTSSPLTNLFIWALMGLPVTLTFAGGWGIWSSFRHRMKKQARLDWAALALPVLNIIFFLFVLALIEVVCGGNFVCHP